MLTSVLINANLIGQFKLEVKEEKFLQLYTSEAVWKQAI